jgi:hypothetical protein
MIFISAAVVLPVGQLARSQVIGFLLFVVLISAVVWSARARPSHVRLRDTYFAWGIITAPCFVVSTLIYPRHHYVVWISVLGLAGLASVLGRCWRDRPSLAAFVGAFVLAMAIGPCLAARVGKKLQFRFGTVSTVTKTGSSVPLSAIAFACPVTPVALGTKETR